MIEAVQFVSPLTALDQKVTENSGTEFCGRSVFVDERGPHLYIRTLEGTHRADNGDWIITGIKGEQYPCKPDIFAATYERADSPEEG